MAAPVSHQRGGRRERGAAWLSGQSCGCRAGGSSGLPHPPFPTPGCPIGTPQAEQPRDGAGVRGAGAGWMRGWQASAAGACSRGDPAWAEVMGEAALTDVVSLRPLQRCPLTSRTPCPVVVPVPSLPRQLLVTHLPMGTSHALQLFRQRCLTNAAVWPPCPLLAPLGTTQRAVGQADQQHLGWLSWRRREALAPHTPVGSARQGRELESHPLCVRCGNQLNTSLHQNGSLLLCAAAVSCAVAGIPG